MAKKKTTTTETGNAACSFDVKAPRNHRPPPCRDLKTLMLARTLIVQRDQLEAGQDTTNLIVVDDIHSIVDQHISGVAFIDVWKSGLQLECPTSEPRMDPSGRALVNSSWSTRLMREALQDVYNVDLFIQPDRSRQYSTYLAAKQQLGTSTDGPEQETLSLLEGQMRSSTKKVLGGGTSDVPVVDTTTGDTTGDITDTTDSDTSGGDKAKPAKGPKFPKFHASILEDAMASEFLDLRLFGGMSTSVIQAANRGAFQFMWGTTLHPVNILSSQLTTDSLPTEEMFHSSQRTIGSVSRVDSGCLRVELQVSPQSAARVKLTWWDLAIALSLLAGMIESSVSGIRTGTRFETGYLFVHPGRLTAEAPRRLTLRVTPTPDGPPDQPRNSMEDYRFLSDEELTDLRAELQRAFKIKVIKF